MRKANDAAIQNAFVRLVTNKDLIVREGMCRVLEGAVHVALAAHDERHQKHLEIGDTYGWMLVHNGQVVDIEVMTNGDDQGDAKDQLLRKASSVPKRGWVGVVMAGMRPASYFAITYELGVLEHARNVTIFDFANYFRPI